VRLEALLLRAQGRNPRKRLQVGDLVLDLATLEAQRGGQVLHLYPACRKLLEVLMRASPGAVTRQQLEFALWGDEPPDGDLLRSHVYELRRSVDGPFADKLIHTLPRVGYRLALMDAADAGRNADEARKPGPLYRRVVWWLLGTWHCCRLQCSVSATTCTNTPSTWRALLNSELDSIVEHVEHEPHYRWQDSDTLSLYRFDAVNLPESLRSLHPGLHDGVMVKGRETAVMVRETQSMGRVALALDISDFHDLEQFATRWVMLAGVIMIFVTVLMASFGMERMVRPLSLLAQHIAGLRPGVQGQRIEVDPRGSAGCIPSPVR
jgi:DNA-binding winged helix-turn-helix (wHTH) protein